MTQQEKNELIAKLSNWVPLQICKDFSGRPFPEFIPDYVRSLDKVHEAERVILEDDEELWDLYDYELSRNTKYVFHTSAEERVDALLRLNGYNV